MQTNDQILSLNYWKDKNKTIEDKQYCLTSIWITLTNKNIQEN